MNGQSGGTENAALAGAAGYLYILVNSSIPDLIKIGRTTRTVSERASELSAPTGVPTPFVVAFEQPVSDCIAAEKAVHQMLEEMGCRVSGNREFFRCSPTAAIRLISQLEFCVDSLPDLDGQEIADPADDEVTLDQEQINILFSDETQSDEELLASLSVDFRLRTYAPDAIATYNSALDHHYGLNDEVRDPDHAMRLYEQAAELGHLEAWEPILDARLNTLGDMISNLWKPKFELEQDPGNRSLMRQLETAKSETKGFAGEIAGDARAACERGNYYCHIRLGRYYVREASYRHEELDQQFGTHEGLKQAGTDEQLDNFSTNSRKCFSRFLAVRRVRVNPAIETDLWKFVGACSELLILDLWRPDGADRDDLKLIKRTLLQRVESDRAQYASLEGPGADPLTSFSSWAADAEAWIRSHLFDPGEEGYRAEPPKQTIQPATESSKNVLVLESTPKNPIKSWLARLAGK